MISCSLAKLAVHSSRRTGRPLGIAHSEPPTHLLVCLAYLSMSDTLTRPLHYSPEQYFVLDECGGGGSGSDGGCYLSPLPPLVPIALHNDGTLHRVLRCCC